MDHLMTNQNGQPIMNTTSDGSDDKSERAKAKTYFGNLLSLIWLA